MYLWFSQVSQVPQLRLCIKITQTNNHEIERDRERCRERDRERDRERNRERERGGRDKD